MKLTIALIVTLLLMAGGANSAAVVVTPGSVAGYMYIEGSGGAAADTLPVQAENAACTATTAANTAINSTYTKILTCNGGIWKPISVGALQTVTAAAACTASDTNNIGVNSTYSKAYLCVAGTWQEYTPTAKSVQTVTEGSACAANATNNIAVSADFSKILSCQSGSWQRDPAARCPSGQVYSGGSCVPGGPGFNTGQPGTGCAGSTYCGRANGQGVCLDGSGGSYSGTIAWWGGGYYYHIGTGNYCYAGVFWTN